ncbi:hypothetical protein [Streptomyces oceani]|uniref:hypothetical protein n=1 Tax=Streptomyces oceani TaxID=1075402 RepID=UPI001112DDCA|nr:hypothetical protein [Streptomyces oceani]
MAGRLLRGQTVVDATQVREFLHAAAGPEDGLEHAYAETDMDSAETVLYLRARTAEHAKEAARRIMIRMLAQEELLGWHWEGHS